MRESRDGERGPEIRSDSSNEPEGAKIDRGRKQDQERPADDSPYILRDFRSLSALFICGLLLGLGQSLDMRGRELVFLYLLLGVVHPIRAFDERGAKTEPDHDQYNHGGDPAWPQSYVPKGDAWRKKYAHDAAYRAYLGLRLRRNRGNGSCRCHLKILHHKVA